MAVLKVLYRGEESVTVEADSQGEREMRAVGFSDKAEAVPAPEEDASEGQDDEQPAKRSYVRRKK